MEPGTKIIIMMMMMMIITVRRMTVFGSAGYNYSVRICDCDGNFSLNIFLVGNVSNWMFFFSLTWIYFKMCLD